MRADIYLTEKGIAASRQKAKRLIEEGFVFANGKAITKASTELTDEIIEIKGEVMPYVSRGGLKLKGAIESFSLDVSGLVCLDVGASTGGFTDCLLQNGANKVYAVDCGHNQLDKKLIHDNRVISIEGFNAREISPEIIPEKVDIAVMDVSFISQTLIHPALVSVLKKGALFVTLIKPQFEAGRSNIGKNGIVKNEKARKLSVERVVDSCASLDMNLMGICESPIKGGDGNIEYTAVFVYMPKGEENEKNSFDPQH